LGVSGRHFSKDISSSNVWVMGEGRGEFKKAASRMGFGAEAWMDEPPHPH